jgi:hypothetical protein
MNDAIEINNYSQRSHSVYFERAKMQHAFRGSELPLSGIQFAVLDAFARRMTHPDGALHPGVAWLSAQTGFSLRSVRAALRQLEAVKALVLLEEGRSAGRKATEYGFGPRILAAFHAELQRSNPARAAGMPKASEASTRKVLPGSAAPTRQELPPSSEDHLKSTDDRPTKAAKEEEMPFGKHVGKQLTAIDTAYLRWVAEQAEKTTPELRAAIEAVLAERNTQAERAEPRREMSCERTSGYLAEMKANTSTDPAARWRAMREELLGSQPTTSPS